MKKRLKRRRRINIIRNAAIALVTVAILAVLGYMFEQALVKGEFDVKEISVEGESVLPESMIIEASGVKTGDNIFLVNINDMRSGIGNVLMTDELIIQKKLPDQIRIEIKEKPVLFAYHSGKKFDYVGEDLKIVAENNYLSAGNVPLVSGLEPETDGNVGDSFSLEPSYKFTNILEILRIFKNNNLLGEISEVSITPENLYRIITRQDSEIIVKDLENFKEYFGYIKNIVEKKTRRVQINITTGNYPVQKQR